MRWMWILAGLGMACTTVNAENLLAEGGFEQAAQHDLLSGLPRATRPFYDGTQSSPFEGWAFGGHWERGAYSIVDSSDSHSGKHACQIVCTRRGRGGIATRPLTLAGGTAIRVSAWIKAKDATGGRIRFNFEGSPGDGWAGKDLKTGTYGWQRFSQRATVPGSKTDLQTIVVFLYTSAEGSIWIDDVSVEIVDPSTPDDVEPLTLPASIPEPAGSTGYRVTVVPALEKIYREDSFATTVNQQAEVSAARNEYESIQLVVEAPWRPVRISEVRLSALTGPGGVTIPADALRWNRVDYVKTTVTPPYYAERGLGWYPDPLMPPGPFTVDKRSRTPIWITLKTPRDCPAGEYRGSITVLPEGRAPTEIALKLRVWDFTLSKQTHLRTMTWLGGGVIRAFYGNDWSAQGQRQQDQAIENYEQMLLEHRLGPGGEVASHPPKRADGTYDFSAVDARLKRLIDGGMNAFLIGTAPNLKRQGKKEYSPEFIQEFSQMVRAYCDHLRQRGWADMAYVYTYDEAPRDAWPQVRKIAAAVKEAAPDARILQCLNEPAGISALTGSVDVFDVYIAQYHKTGVAASQKRGAEAWLAVCCYPMDHPNFFLEYPLLDERVVPWICWKYGARGFEYWSPNSWGANWQKKGAKWPAVPWVANAFGRYNGDGYLMYPGPDLRPLSSIRLEALRDGFEDYEYLWMLDSLVKRATDAGASNDDLQQGRKLLTLAGLVTDGGGYATEPGRLARYRAQVASAIVRIERQFDRN